MSGCTHNVCTGVSLVMKHPSGLKEHTFHETSQVTFGELSDEVINAYVATEEPLDKAGSYGIQDLG